MSPQSELSSNELNLMEMEPSSMVNVPHLMEEISQNMSDESDIEDYDNASFGDTFHEVQHSNVESEDFEGASFDDAFHDLYHPQTMEWPNDAYREFMELVNR